MKGIVDESLRAFVDVFVAATKESPKVPLTAWVDTAFNGSLVIPRRDIERLGLKLSSTTQAVLADGSVVEAETFTCYIQWFGAVYQTQAVANDGPFPLLGTLLLRDRRLMIDYGQKSVILE